MIRFVGLVWNPTDLAVNAHASRLLGVFRSALPDFSRIMATEGLTVFLATECAASGRIEPQYTSLGSQRGVVVGTLFRTHTAASTGPLAHLAEREAENVIISKGRHLVEHYWGRYVAFLRNREVGYKLALRDPMGMLPCFITHHLGVSVVFSNLSDVLSLGVDLGGVNWNYVTARTCVSWRLEGRQTGLSKVSNVLAGQCIEWNGHDVTERFVWNPFHIANESRLEDPAAAATALRSTAGSVVGQLAALHDSILVSLSGGFDSSVVLGCLKDAPTKPLIRCINHFSSSPGHDEREFARSAAQFSQAPLLERERTSKLDLRRILSVALTSPVPTLYIQWLERSAIEAEAARDFGATAVFGGHYGDALFFQNAMGLAAADYLSDYGVSKGLFSIALRAAYTDSVSIWHVLHDAIKLCKLHRRGLPHTEEFCFRKLTRDALLDIKTIRDYVHPWFHANTSLPPGKLRQIYFLCDPKEYYNPFHVAGYPDYVYPLLGQPLVEVSMRIPTYVLTLFGTDRGLARRAFARDISPRVAARRTKGQMEDHYRPMLAKSIVFVREALLDGKLVREGILDRAKLEVALSSQPNNIKAGLVEIFDYLSIEAWLSAVERASARLAA